MEAFSSVQVFCIRTVQMRSPSSPPLLLLVPPPLGASGLMGGSLSRVDVVVGVAPSGEGLRTGNASIAKSIFLVQIADRELSLSLRVGFVRRPNSCRDAVVIFFPQFPRLLRVGDILERAACTALSMHAIALAERHEYQHQILYIHVCDYELLNIVTTANKLHQLREGYIRLKSSEPMRGNMSVHALSSVNTAL